MIKRVSETVAEIEASPAPKDNLLAYTWCVDWEKGDITVSPVPIVEG